MVEDTGEEIRIARCGLVGRLALHDGLYDLTSLASSSKIGGDPDRGLLLDVEVADLAIDVADDVQREAVAGQFLIVLGDTRLLPGLVLQLVQVVVSPDIQGDRLVGESLHEDLELVHSTNHGFLHAADVQGALLHVGDVLAVVKEQHLIVYYLVVFNGVVVFVVDSSLIIIVSK